MSHTMSAGHVLADRIERHLGTAKAVPGTIIGSEQQVREQHGAGRVLFRQAMRILEHRGVVRLRRGQGGGVLFLGHDDQSIARDLARLIESRTLDPDDIWELQRAADLRIYASEGRRLRHADAIRLRGLIAALESMSQAQFARELGHRQLQSMLRSVLHDEVLVLVQRVVMEAGIDLFPARWHVAGESFRRDFWVLSIAFAESLIANDVPGMVMARQGQLLRMREAFQAARQQAEMALGSRSTAADDGGPVVSGNRVDFLVRELLDEVRSRNWVEGARLGTAPELMDRYKVSLSVLREATRVLEEGGAIRVSRGRHGGFEVGSPAAAPTRARAVAFIARTADAGGGIADFLTDLLATALGQAPLRARPAEIAALDDAVAGCVAPFSIADPASRALCRAVAGLSRNAALETFVELLLDASPCGPDRPCDGQEPPAILASLLAAVRSQDAGLARRALLEHLHSGG